MRVPFVDMAKLWTPVKAELHLKIDELLDSGVLMQNQQIQEFENQFASYIGTAFAKSTASCTDALYLILKSLGIGKGDEVIVPAMTWFADAEVVSACGAKPVFVDIDEFFTLDSAAVLDKINTNTKAVLAVHLYGQLCDMSVAFPTALIEDVAQAHGAEWKGKKAGSFGQAAAFSFYPTKNLPALGDSGMVLSNEQGLVNKVRQLSMHGQIQANDHTSIGINSRMDGIQAVALNLALQKLDQWNEKRINFAQIYFDKLADFPLELPCIRPDTKHVFHQFVIKYKKRDELSQYLHTQGIETKVHYPTIVPLQTAYQTMKHTKSEFPNAFSLSEEGLSLPIHPGLTIEQIEFTAEKIGAYFEK